MERTRKTLLQGGAGLALAGLTAAGLFLGQATAAHAERLDLRGPREAHPSAQLRPGVPRGQGDVCRDAGYAASYVAGTVCTYGVIRGGAKAGGGQGAAWGTAAATTACSTTMTYVQERVTQTCQNARGRR